MEGATPRLDLVTHVAAHPETGGRGHTYRDLKRGLSSQSTGLAATMLGTRALRTDGLWRGRGASVCVAPSSGRAAWRVARRLGADCEGSPPDIETMVGVRGVLGPLEQRPLKLNGDLGGRVGRQLDQHLQEVWL